MNLGGNWFANACLKYIFVPRSRYDIASIKVQVEMDTLLIGSSIAYRF